MFLSGIKKNRPFFYRLGLFLLTVLFFSSCETPLWYAPVRDWFDKYTNTAAVEIADMPEGVKNAEGILSVPSDKDIIINFCLRNPRDYTLQMWYEPEEEDVRLMVRDGDYYTSTEVFGGDFPGIIVNQNAGDKSLASIKLKKEFLTAVDTSGVSYKKNISGEVKIIEVESGRDFASFPISLCADSVPPEIKGACFQSDKEDFESGNAKYIICFYMPVISSNDVHYRDTYALYIDNEVRYFKYESNAYKFYKNLTFDDSGNPSFSDQDTSFTTSAQVYPLGDAPSFNVNAPDGYKSVYYNTGWNITSSERKCSLKISDIAGLNSKVNISSKATKLNAPVIRGPDNNTITSGLSYAADEGTQRFTVRITHDGKDEEGNSCGTVNITYTIKEKNNKLVFANGTSSVLTKTVSGNTLIELPAGKYDITAAAGKNYYLTSDATTVTDVTITKPAVYYVKAGGNDDPSCGTSSNPVATIQYAVKQFMQGVSNGEYPLNGVCKIYVMSDIESDGTEGNNPFVYIPPRPADLPGVDDVIYGSAPFVGSIYIMGSGAKRTVNAKKNSSRTGCVICADSGTVYLENLTITGGYLPDCDSSAGIEARTSMNLKNVTVRDNIIDEPRTDRDMGGAGLRIEANSVNITCTDCEFINNKTKAQNGGAVYIYDESSVAEFIRCKFTDNVAGYDKDADEHGSGGAIYLNIDTVKLTDCTFTGNKSSFGGGAICNVLGNLELKGNNTFTNNSAGIKRTFDTYSTWANDHTELLSRFYGGALYAEDCTVKIEGKITAKDNYRYRERDEQKLSNFYLCGTTSPVLTVTGPLTGSKIGIGMYFNYEPAVNHPVEFTTGYKYNLPGGNSSNPAEIFISETTYGIKDSDDAEACFAVSSAKVYAVTDYVISVKRTLGSGESESDPVYLYPGVAKKIVLKRETGFRKESDSNQSPLYFNPVDKKLYLSYENGTYTRTVPVPDKADPKVTFKAALYSGDYKVKDLTVTTSANDFSLSLSGITDPGNYRIRITSEFLGVKRDTVFVLNCGYNSDVVENYIRNMTSGGTVVIKGKLESDYSNGELGKIAQAIISNNSLNADNQVTLDLRETTSSDEIGNYNRSYFGGCGPKLKEVFFPDWYTEMGLQFFNGCNKLIAVHFPETFTKIVDASFSGCTGLTDIYFAGTKEKWKNVNKQTGWNTPLPSNCVIHCSDGNLDKQDNEIN